MERPRVPITIAESRPTPWYLFIKFQSSRTKRIKKGLKEKIVDFSTAALEPRKMKHCIKN